MLTVLPSAILARVASASSADEVESSSSSPTAASPPSHKNAPLSLLSASSGLLGRPPSTSQRRRRGLLVWGLAGVLVLLGVMLLMGSILYLCHRGFRRTIQFWRGIAPLIVEYKRFQWMSDSQHWDNATKEDWLHDYHQRTAPKLVHLILSLGGIYVKIGQVFSTIGQGLLPDEYVIALQPLQDGVPPRSLTEIAAIIEKSTGKRLDEIFVDFDPTPLGAASIAQAHRARLVLPSSSRHPHNDNNESYSIPVVVKVQYPEVATLFRADLQNLEWAVRFLVPDQVSVVQALRKRHERELNFHYEAQHLQECRLNLMKHPTVRDKAIIPAVRNETGLCTEHVLIMDYLDGIPLSRAIELEQSRLAKALGHVDGKSLRTAVRERLREHFEAGGGVEEVRDNNGAFRALGRVQLFQALGPWAAAVLRTYATVKDGVQGSLGVVHQARGAVWRSLQGEPPQCRFDNNNEECSSKSSSSEQRPSQHREYYPRINLSRVLKTLVQVHGLQLLRDGVYNADPHPGNVLVLPDGRLGLLDYGMVGRLSVHERATVAHVLVALGRRDPHRVANIYLAEGFRATLAGQPIRDVHLLHRFATFHMDRIDLSPIALETGERLELRTLLESTVVQSTPEWVVQARRLCGLLMGVSAQAARPVSLAREWETIARSVVREAGDDITS